MSEQETQSQKTRKMNCVDCGASHTLNNLQCANYDYPVSECNCGDCEPYCSVCWAK